MFNHGHIHSSTFRYEGPGYYKTRDGRKALVGEDPRSRHLTGVIFGSGDPWSGGDWTPNDTSPRWLRPSGVTGTSGPTDSDLVGKWEETDG